MTRTLNLGLAAWTFVGGIYFKILIDWMRT